MWLSRESNKTGSVSALLTEGFLVFRPQFNSDALHLSISIRSCALYARTTALSIGCVLGARQKFTGGQRWENLHCAGR